MGDVRDALDKARFEDAARLAQTLLEAKSTRARDRNDALELLAIVQIAQRSSARASQTLKTLFDRDPEHPQRVHDPGPAVDAAIARERRAVRSQATAVITANTRRDAYGRELLDVELPQGADMVDTIHVFVRSERDPTFTELVHHLDVNERVTVLLPAAALGATRYQWYVEARAPSGWLLARLASMSEPNESMLKVPDKDPALTCTVVKTRERLRDQWWVWTSVGIVVSGIVIGSAVAAQ